MKQLLKNNMYLFFSVFITLNIIFLYYTTTFFIGNHDWDWVKGTTQVLSLSTGMFEARFGKFILNVLLFSGHIFPILNNFVSFILLSIGAVLLAKYWNINKLLSAFIVSISFTATPFILGWLYFPINILGNFSAIPLVVGGLILIEKEKILPKIIALLFFILALGVYPSTMEMIFIVFFVRQIILKETNIRKVLKSFSIIILSLAIFKLLLIVLAHYHLIMSNYYNMELNSINDIIRKIPEFIKLFFSQLWTTIPFFPRMLKLTGGIIVILALSSTIKNIRNIIFWFIICGATILSSVLTSNINETALMPRVNFYGLNFLYAGSIAILLMQKTIWRNFGYLFGLIYLVLSINESIYAQKVWHLGKISETNLVMRMSSRIEEKSKILPLTPILTDEISLRPKYYYNKFDKTTPYILERSFIVRHIPSGMFNFYAPNTLFYGSSQIRELTPDLYNYLRTVDTPWPNDKGLYIDNEYAVIMSTRKGIEAIKAQLPK
ncbi:MAG: hypothetical protein IJZ30_03300 [Alphaproteobacteria bacterium]|nr:hypothetical protein [Alphaproteobacteria bacterium]